MALRPQHKRSGLIPRLPPSPIVLRLAVVSLELEEAELLARLPPIMQLGASGARAAWLGSSSANDTSGGVSTSHAIDLLVSPSTPRPHVRTLLPGVVSMLVPHPRLQTEMATVGADLIADLLLQVWCNAPRVTAQHAYACAYACNGPPLPPKASPSLCAASRRYEHAQSHDACRHLLHRPLLAPLQVHEASPTDWTAAHATPSPSTTAMAASTLDNSVASSQLSSIGSALPLGKERPLASGRMADMAGLVRLHFPAAHLARVGLSPPSGHAASLPAALPVPPLSSVSFASANSGMAELVGEDPSGKCGLEATSTESGESAESGDELEGWDEGDLLVRASSQESSREGRASSRDSGRGASSDCHGVESNPCRSDEPDALMFVLCVSMLQAVRPSRQGMRARPWLAACTVVLMPRGSMPLGRHEVARQACAAARQDCAAAVCGARALARRTCLARLPLDLPTLPPFGRACSQLGTRPRGSTTPPQLRVQQQQPLRGQRRKRLSRHGWASRRAAGSRLPRMARRAWLMPLRAQLVPVPTWPAHPS